MAPRREIFARKRSGETFPIEATIFKIDTSDGPLLTAIIRDLTEANEMQVRLIHAEKMKVLGQMAGGIAHDFNNLLSIIRGNTEIARDHAILPQAIERQLEAINSSCAHGADLIKPLLVFSRKSAPTAQVINLAAILEEVVAVLRRTVGVKIAVTARLNLPHANILADPALIQTVLLNLAFNARDAISDGGEIVFTLKGAPTEKSGPEFIILTVEDTGHGMSENVRARIFEPFYTTKPEGKGTGLGLSMVYSIVTQTGGTIEVKSIVGKGSCFTLCFPASVPQNTPDAAATRPGRKDLGGVRILHVEDNQDLRDICAIHMQQLGAGVFSASNAREALEIVESGAHFDILVTDLHLGDGISGAALALALRQRLQHLGVVVTTGYLDLTHAANLDPDWIMLQKPLSRADLRTGLLTMLNRSASD